MLDFLIEARHSGPADGARVAVIARPVIYAAVWRSSRNCHHARVPSAAALVTCAGLAVYETQAAAVAATKAAGHDVGVCAEMAEHFIQAAVQRAVRASVGYLTTGQVTIR